jgi:hypothetical protein
MFLRTGMPFHNAAIEASEVVWVCSSRPLDEGLFGSDNLGLSQLLRAK